MFWRKKDNSPADIRRLLMAGGTITHTEWQSLTEEQKQAAEAAAADKFEMESIYSAFLLTPDPLIRETLAQAFARYDGGALYKQLLQKQNQMALEAMERGEHLADNQTTQTPA